MTPTLQRQSPPAFGDAPELMSPTVSVLEPPGHGEGEPLATLGGVLGANPQLSGSLSKLITHTDPDNAANWRQRYFVLASDLNLYLFRKNAMHSSHALSYLPVTSCHGQFDTLTLYLRGLGVDFSDSHLIVERTWTVRCSSEDSFSVWLRTLQRALLTREKSSVAAVGAGVVSVAPTRLARSASLRSNGKSDHWTLLDRENELHGAYVHLQKS